MPPNFPTISAENLQPNIRKFELLNMQMASTPQSHATRFLLRLHDNIFGHSFRDHP